MENAAAVHCAVLALAAAAAATAAPPACVETADGRLRVTGLPANVRCVLRSDDYNDVGRPVVDGTVIFTAPVKVAPASIRLEWYTNAACTNYVPGSDQIITCTGSTPTTAAPTTAAPTTAAPTTAAPTTAAPTTAAPTTATPTTATPCGTAPPTPAETCCGAYFIGGPRELQVHVQPDIKCVLSPAEYNVPGIPDASGNLAFSRNGVTPELELYTDSGCTQFARALSCCLCGPRPPVCPDACSFCCGPAQPASS